MTYSSALGVTLPVMINLGFVHEILNCSGKLTSHTYSDETLQILILYSGITFTIRLGLSLSPYRIERNSISYTKIFPQCHFVRQFSNELDKICIFYHPYYNAYWYYSSS